MTKRLRKVIPVGEELATCMVCKKEVFVVEGICINCGLEVTARNKPAKKSTSYDTGGKQVVDKTTVPYYQEKHPSHKNVARVLPAALGSFIGIILFIGVITGVYDDNKIKTD